MSEIADRVTLGEIMEQAQVFASAWSLLGSRFDDGSKLRLSQDEKDNLEVMVGMLVNEAILSDRERCAKIPEGWVLVPVEPTREMWAAMGNTLFYGYRNRHHDKVAGDLYRAAIAAAPSHSKASPLRMPSR